jgi:molecular chaperone IbpA
MCGKAKSALRPLETGISLTISWVPQANRLRQSRSGHQRRTSACRFTGGYAMRTFDLSPLYRSTVGFDRLFSLLDNTAGFDNGGTTYPPYNIERTGDNSYRVTIAVAGFSESDLSIEAKENTLTVRGERKPEADARPAEVLYQGIAARAFERVFRLAEFVEVKSAKLEKGLLHIDMVREIPEAMKPRAIRINGARESKVLDTKAA